MEFDRVFEGFRIADESVVAMIRAGRTAAQAYLDRRADELAQHLAAPPSG